MQAYETSTTVQSQGEVRVAGVPFAPGTEVEVMISPRRKDAAEFAQAWERVCSQLRATPGVGELSDADIQAEIDAVSQTNTKSNMSTLTVQLPESLAKNIEALAAKEGYTVSQFLASAAGEKLAVVMTMDYLRSEANAGRREDFECYLSAVPDVPPRNEDRLD